MSKKFKPGQTVRWTSQAGGCELTKRGTIVAVCRTAGIELTKKATIQMLREVNPDITIKQAERKARHVNYYGLLREKYRVKFDYNWRDETPHYLVEVAQGEGRKSHLYHPKTEALEATSILL